MNRRSEIVLPLIVLLLLAAGCNRSASECSQAVEVFRSPTRSDSATAGAVDAAIAQARAHRSDSSADCVLANKYADDVEASRPVAAVSPAARVTVVAEPTPAYVVEAAGTPRVHLEIGVTKPVVPEAASTTAPVQSVRTEPRPSYETNTASGNEKTPQPLETSVSQATPAATATAPAAAASAVADKTPNANAACHKACDNTANFQARVACNQRCDGATPLPDAMASPTIIH